LFLVLGAANITFSPSLIPGNYRISFWLGGSLSFINASSSTLTLSVQSPQSPIPATAIFSVPFTPVLARVFVFNLTESLSLAKQTRRFVNGSEWGWLEFDQTVWLG